MDNMRQEDLQWVVRRLPKDVKEMMKSLRSNVCLGGGFIRSCITGDPINDLDLFVDSVDTEKKVVEMLKGITQKIIRSKNAVTLITHTFPIQIIHRWLYERPEDVLSDFDFSITCAVVWYDGVMWCGKVHPLYYSDLAAKRLTYLHPNRDEDVGGSVLRVLKYYRKGYNITLNSFAGTISRLMSGVRRENEAAITDEDERTRVLTGLLVEVDPSAVLGSEIVRDNGDEIE